MTEGRYIMAESGSTVYGKLTDGEYEAVGEALVRIGKLAARDRGASYLDVLEIWILADQMRRVLDADRFIMQLGGA